MHYHLFPKDVVGLGLDKKNPTFAIAWGNNHRETTPDKEGNYWWSGGDGIYIMRTAKFRRCDECNAEINCKWRTNPVGRKVVSQYGSWHVSTRTYVYRDYYVGIADNCFVYYWGVENHLCLNCARKFFGNHEVYKCPDFDLGTGYFTDPPPDWVLMKDQPRLVFNDLLPKESWRRK